MLFYLTIILLFLSPACALKYQMVAPGSNSASVQINGQTYTMTRKWADVPYYTVEVNTATTAQTYKYVVDSVAETFDRVWPSCKPTATYNDFFGRQDTIKKLDRLGYAFDTKTEWTRDVGPKGVFNEDYINTVIFTGNINQFFMDVSNKSKVENLTIAMINRDDEEYFSGVEVNIEDTSQRKPKMKLDLEDNYKGRSTYKLRPSSSDPVFIRDKLYNDILEAAGCPHEESGFVRVYINNKGLGLYNLQEAPSSKDFIKTQFYGNETTYPTRPDPLGVYLDGTTGADFSPSVVIEAFVPGKGTSNAGIMNLINALAALNPLDDAAVQSFSQNWFDIDYFFRAIAMEYLTGSYDSYWFQTTNFLVYNDITENTANAQKWYFIDQDFDQTFGTNLGPIYNPYGSNYTIIPYTAFVNKTWNVVPYDAPHRTMVDKLMSSPALVAKFEGVLKTYVRGIFNPIALGRRITSLMTRIRPDIVWDYTLGADRAHYGNQSIDRPAVVWTVEQFDTGLTTGYGGNWGLMNWINERANFLASEFGISFIDPPLSPPADTCTEGNNGSTGTTKATTGKPPNGSTTSSTTGNGSVGGSSTGTSTTANGSSDDGTTDAPSDDGSTTEAASSNDGSTTAAGSSDDASTTASSSNNGDSTTSTPIVSSDDGQGNENFSAGAKSTISFVVMAVATLIFTL